MSGRVDLKFKVIQRKEEGEEHARSSMYPSSIHRSIQPTIRQTRQPPTGEHVNDASDITKISFALTSYVFPSIF
jgi:hypothetical protein